LILDVGSGRLQSFLNCLGDGDHEGVAARRADDLNPYGKAAGG
jgi:hypothetical protein